MFLRRQSARTYQGQSQGSTERCRNLKATQGYGARCGTQDQESSRGYANDGTELNYIEFNKIFRMKGYASGNERNED